MHTCNNGGIFFLISWPCYINQILSLLYWFWKLILALQESSVRCSSTWPRLHPSPWRSTRRFQLGGTPSKSTVITKGQACQGWKQCTKRNSTHILFYVCKQINLCSVFMLQTMQYIGVIYQSINTYVKFISSFLLSALCQNGQMMAKNWPTHVIQFV